MPKSRWGREDEPNTHIGQLFYRIENAETIFGDVDDNTETCRHRKKGCTFSVMLMLQQLNKGGGGGGGVSLGPTDTWTCDRWHKSLEC